MPPSTLNAPLSKGKWMQRTLDELVKTSNDETPNGSSVSARPFIKWAGGKGQLLPQIRKAFPSELGKSIKKYADPFIGGGAVLFEVLNNFEMDEVYISDVNSELIGTYKAIRDDHERLIGLLKQYEAEYLALSEGKPRQGRYYEARDRFNELKMSPSDSVNTEIAALLIFLNRTCFNGLYRVNAKNLFNVPSGRYKNPRICDEANIRAVSEKLQNVEIVCGDYHESDSFIDENTFVYMDPPYRPLSETSNFNSYAKDSFNDESQKELAEYFRHLSDKGAKVMESNSDPKNVDPDDNFFDDIFEGFNISRIKASRMINSKGDGRGKINELLITNYDY